MTFAITIGCYRLVDCIELCIKRTRTVFGADCFIMLSDDLSPESPRILELADKYDCHYLAPKNRRSHFSGDMQAAVNCVAHAQALNADVGIKLSQRLIPVLPEFRLCLERAFADPKVMVALPGKLHPRQIARPAARFYTAFGILTDVLAIRRGAITPEQLIEAYRERFQTFKAHGDCLIETTWGWLLSRSFKDAHVIVPELTNHVPFTPKVYLRKAQSTVQDYKAVARMEGLDGDYDLREWVGIEGKGYFCRPTEV